MADYKDLELIVVFDGDKAKFETAGTDGKIPKDVYKGRLVLITGNTTNTLNLAKKPQIYASDENGNGKYIPIPYSYVVGLKAGNNTIANVDKIIEFVGANGINVTADPATGKVTFNGQTLKEDLIGTTENNSVLADHPNTITGAKAYTDKVASDLKGTKAVGDTTAETIRGAKDYAGAVAARIVGGERDNPTDSTVFGAKKYADDVAASEASTAKSEAIQASKDYVDPLLANKADLEDGKIKESQLPDYILGQMLFGGTLDGGTETQLIVDPTENLMDKVGKTGSDLNADGKLVIANTSFQAYEGVYFISSINFGNTNVANIPDVRIGDWIISTGTRWRKVDNTDAVASVAGLTGTITASALAQKLAATDDNNELALKSEVDKKYTKPDDGIPETDLKDIVVAKLNKGYSSVQEVSGGDFISVTDTSGTTNKKSYEVSAKTKTMEAAKVDILLNGEDALATAHDVYNFIKARLSVKVVS